MHGGWSSDRVIERLVVFFRARPGVAIRVEGEEPTPDKPVDGIELARIALRHLGPEAAQFLLAYARARAAGTSLRDLSRDKGWAKATLYRRTRSAAGGCCGPFEPPRCRALLASVRGLLRAIA